jgi:hypothetical protein
MALLENTFDATQVEPGQSFEILPAGDYEVHIVRSDMKPTKAGTGHLLELEMDVLSGECVGRKVWDRLNIVNENQTAQEIAQRTLSAICHATGVMHVRDSEQLHFHPMIAKVAVEERKDKPGEYSNRVKAYKPRDGGAAPAHVAAAPSQAPAAAPAPPPQQPAATAKAPPWRRNA